MTVIYLYDRNTELLGMSILPAKLEDKYVTQGKWTVESLVQVKAIGDPYPDGFSHGHTMRNSRTARNLKLVQQTLEEGDHSKTVVTTLRSDKLEAIHRLSYEEGAYVLNSVTEIKNRTPDVIGIEMLSSYSVCGFSSLEEEERMQDFKLHRLRSKWSAEGKLDSSDLVELQLEPSWMRSGVQSIRYGEVGSMPVRRYFPWMVLEDVKYGYCVGSQLYHPASWQMEVYNRDDRISFSGGIADREFGHWVKNLAPGEVFITPKAILSTCMGTVNEISHRLTSAQNKNLSRVPEIEKALPIVFNEFCTTWGSPSLENIKKIVRTIQDKGITYCVIDAGWYAKKIGDWSNVGDWEVNEELFPGGFGEAVNAIREAGMVPGIWFELEIVGRDSAVFEKEELLLKRDGYPIQTGIRRFFDMRKPEVIDYLSEKVIGLLKKYGFGYLKVDYNDNLGIGCEGAESLGEGLRENMLASQEFFRRIRKELPDLVIENCSSGGHRLEPSMQELCSMSSFSDAHECREIPIIAANVHRAILPAQSQIWAVLRKEDSIKRITYSIANTFLGRMCLSGDVYDLSKEQWDCIEQGMQFYQSVSPIIRNGKSKYYGSEIAAYNHPEGWQAVIRSSTTDNKELAVVHTFEKAPQRIEIPVGEAITQIKEIYARPEVSISLKNHKLILEHMEDFEGIGIKLC
jgi:alpha-galactosidase